VKFDISADVPSACTTNNKGHRIAFCYRNYKRLRKSNPGTESSINLTP